MSNCNFKLNLPTDIPWKRICVSKDMIDDKLCDRKFPYRWRSSITAFEYEPEEEHQNYEGMTISYLKVSCTITGYQEDPDEIGLDYKGIRSFWKNQPGIENYLEVIQKYYACHGAILEVSVGPKDKNISPDKFPYFLDFEPKKRELYELVSVTGETTSRSLNNIEIGKSNTSLRSHEVIDVDKGWGFGVETSSPSGGSSLNVSNQKESGTRDVSQNEYTNLKSTDTSQEMRETLSHTTQLSQMYHQLDSYHIGTNRAVFFIHPRPHTIETEHTFVNGPRNIEGIQEFLFVVARPKEVKAICVEAYLETGHIGKIPADPTTEEVSGSERVAFFSDEFKAEYKDNDETTYYDYQDKIWDVNDHHPGYEIKSAVLTRGTPVYIGEKNDEPEYISELIDMLPQISHVDRYLVKVSGKVHSFYKNQTFEKDDRASISYPFQVRITLIQRIQVINETDVLFITGRKLCCCPEIKSKFKPGIVFERKHPWSDMVFNALESPLNGATKLPVSTANQMAVEIKENLIHSRTDMEHRYFKESINLPQTDFALKVLSEIFNESNNTRISQLNTISNSIKHKILNFHEGLTIKDVFTMPFEMQRDLFDLEIEQVIELRNDLIGVNHKYDSKSAWLNEKQLERLFKPDKKDIKTNKRSK